MKRLSIFECRFSIGLAMLILCAPIARADTTDLRPVSPNVQQGWSVVAGCTNDSTEWDCVNEDVESHDSDTIALTATDAAGVSDEFNITNRPGDFGSTNSITLKVVAKWTGANDDNDRVDFSLEVSGTPVGGTKCFSHNDTIACSCTQATANAYITCSFTDSPWNTLTGTQIDNLTLVMTTVANNVSMPDTTTFNVTAAELVLDYNVGGAHRLMVME